MERLLSQLSVRLIFKGIKLVTVESCTGGLISKQATDLAGSSRWFEAGMVTYSNFAKSTLVKVPNDLLEKYGAVSEPVAIAMADGAAKIFESVVSVSVTGIAGPDGGTAEKPVGTVCFAVSYAGKTISRTKHFEGNRDAIRQQSARTAIEMVLDLLSSSK